MKVIAICVVLLFGAWWIHQAPRNERFAVVVTEHSAELTTLEGCEHGKKVILDIPESEWPESWKGWHEKNYIFALRRDEEDGRLKFAGRVTPDCAPEDGCCWEQHARDSHYESMPSSDLNTDGTCAN